MPIDHYLAANTYRALVAALAALEPYGPTGVIEEHQVIEVLGEFGGIWPDSIRPGGAIEDAASEAA